MSNGTAEGSASDPLVQLSLGDLFWFADWPCGAVPRKGAIVYTIWDRSGGFIYVGQSAPKPERRRGPYDRLDQHCRGHRNRDKFCVYVCDRLVLPTLTRDQIGEIAAGTLSLDALIGTYVQAHFGFRWVSCADRAAALALETRIKEGALGCGRPLLNPRLPASP